MYVVLECSQLQVTIRLSLAAEIISGVVPELSYLATTTTDARNSLRVSHSIYPSNRGRGDINSTLWTTSVYRSAVVQFQRETPTYYMSSPDIPLHTIAPNSRSRAAYAPLTDQHNFNSQGDDQTPEKTNMHTGALRSSAAVRTTTRGFGSGRSKGKGKQREQYADESDEEATLLGHVERIADGDPDGDDDGDIGSEGQGSTRLRRLEGSQLSKVR